jgi:hypothetical protein
MAQDSALSRALARQETLRLEIEDRQRELKDVDTFISLYPRFVDGGPPNRAEASPESGAENDALNPGEEHRVIKRSGLTQPKFEKLARELLLARGRPAQRRALLDLFRDSGTVIGGTDEMRNLGTKLWYARAMLTNIRGEGYWPADVPCVAVGYVPPQEDVKDSDNLEMIPPLHSAAAE